MGGVRRFLVPAVVVGLGAAGCAGSGSGGEARTRASSSAVPTASTVTGGFPRCDDVPDVEAPADWYDDTPVYVANEQPVAEVRDWADDQPGFVSVGVDRSHNGWIWAAFTEQVEQRQRDLEERFPGVGVVAVEAEHSNEELAALQERVNAVLMSHGSGYFSTGYGNAKHILMVNLGVLSDERLAALEEFRGEPICVEGGDPADVVPEGPQPEGGEGWRLLGDDLVGSVYRTGVATTAEQYVQLWADAGLTGPVPDVDFETEVVVWFGAVYGGSCPIRLDGVIVDADRALVHGEIVIPGNAVGCTADARPHSYVVAIDRSTLPVGPFAIQLDAEDPPAGAPEERTLVDADLSTPGAVATPDQIGPDPSLLDGLPAPPDPTEPGG